MAATDDDGKGQSPAVSPSQHSAWFSPNMGQDPSRQAACPWTYPRDFRHQEHTMGFRLAPHWCRSVRAMEVAAKYEG
jgi:hypothetical protein